MTDQQQQQQAGDQQQQQQQQAADFDWGANGFEGEDLGYVQNKGFRTVKDAMTSYRNLESLVGADKATILRLPKDQTPEALNEIYTKLGRPEKVEGYKIPLPDGDDGSLAKAAAPWFHEAGLNQRQVDIIVGKLNEHVGAQLKAGTELSTAEAAKATEALKTEWGATYDQNVELVEKAAGAFGMSKDQLLALREVMGPAAAMKFMHNIGAKLGAGDKLPDDLRNNTGKLTPEQALAELAAKKADHEWRKKLLNNDAPTVAENERLHRFAYPQ